MDRLKIIFFPLLVILFTLATLYGAEKAKKAKDLDGKKKETKTKKKEKEKEKEKKEEDTKEKGEKIIVSASRREAKIFDVPYSTRIYDNEELNNRRMVRYLPEVFADDPSVLVQKTAYGQGSPYLRGFTSFRNLMLIDGIRLNHSVFRSGPNQYWATIDPFIIDRLEVIKGPASVQYGSDAIGGTVNIITRKRKDFSQKGFHWDRRLYYRYGSASASHVARIESQGNYSKKIGFLGGFTYKNFDEVSAGRNLGVQPKTGYWEVDGDFKIQYRLSNKSTITGAYQHVSQNDVWRSHKTLFGISFAGTTIGDEQRRVLEQDRDLLYVQMETKNVARYLERVKASLSYHLQRETRNRIRNDGRKDVQGFEVGTLGAWVQFESPTPFGIFTYGVEHYHDNVDSFRENFNSDGSFNSFSIQGPVGDEARYDLFGAFIQNEIEILPERLVFTVGGRFTYVDVAAKKVEDPDTGNQIAIEDSFDSVVGSGRMLYYVFPRHWNLFIGASQGFRAPNLSDLTRLDTARSNEIETPSPGLDAERYLTLEMGTKVKYRGFRANLAYYYTFIEDQIIRFPTGDTIGGDQEVQKANVGDGFVYGIEFNMDYEFSQGGPFWAPFPKDWGRWSFYGGFTFFEGYVDTFPTSAQILREEPISRMLPPTGIVGIKWQDESGRFWLGGYIKMVAPQDRLSSRDRNDTQRIPPGGTPGYAIVSVRAGWKVRPNFIVSAAVENIGDKNYRVHGSGQNEAGTNFLFSVDWRF